jgi:hypothetical protein
MCSDALTPCSRRWLTIALLLLAGCSLDDRWLQEVSGGGGSSGAEPMGGRAGQGTGAGSYGGSAVVAGNAGVAGSGGTPGEGGRGGAAGSGGGPGASGCPDLDDNGIADCEETIVENPTFDVDVRGWEAEASLARAWDVRDARGDTESGALSTVNELILNETGNTMGGARQCLPAWRDRVYSLATRVLIPEGQGDGKGGINVTFFGAENCADYLLSGETPTLAEAAGAWTVVRAQVKAPPAARSMFVRLVAEKPYSQAAFQVLFDDVLVREKE